MDFMSSRKSKTKILFIQGVFLEDVMDVDNIMENKLLLTHDEKIIKGEDSYQPLPCVFHSLDNWPKSTRLHCWNCDCQHNNIPVFLPCSIEPSKEHEYSIRVEGVFCSFNCAKAYLDLYYTRINDNINKKQMLHYLYKIFNKKEVKDITPSPNKYLMQKYGGNYSTNDYIELVRNLKNIY